jgi:SAM-dependent methyltransferase
VSPDDAVYTAGVRDVLDLGCGGGHVAMHLKASGQDGALNLTLVDISPQMLAVSRRLNPECAHHQGDMRTVRLGATFDAVLVHDAVDYITSRNDLRQVISTAHAHCRPGGIALFVPDHVQDTFRPASGAGGSSDPAGRQGSFRERIWDPDPSDDMIAAEYVFTLREADGTSAVITETHELGAFSRATWTSELTRAGFEPQPAPSLRLVGRRPANLFIAARRALSDRRASDRESGQRAGRSSAPSMAAYRRTGRRSCRPWRPPGTARPPRGRGSRTRRVPR